MSSYNGFHEILLSPYYPYGTTYGPGYSTSVTNFPNNSEQRFSYTPTSGIMRWKMKKTSLDITWAGLFESFVRGRRGRFFGFRFKHYQGHNRQNEPLPYVNASLTMQLQFQCGDDFNPETQIVYKPIDLVSLASTDPNITGQDILLQKDTAGNGIFLNFIPGSSNASIPPVISSVALAASGTIPVGTYYYVITAVNTNGETLVSNEYSITTTTGNQKVVLDWTELTTVPATTNYNIYRGSASGAEVFLHKVGVVTTFTDDGSYIATSQVPPVYSLDRTTGVVTLPVAAANGTQFLWSGDYHYPVRFDVEAGNQITVNEFNAFDVEDIPLVELKNPNSF